MSAQERFVPGSERGAAAVEFALVLPLIILLVFGMTTFGIAVARLEGYESAARDAARFAAVRCQSPSTPTVTSCTTDAIRQRVLDAYSGNDAEIPIATVYASRDCSASGSLGLPVTVSWNQPLDLKIPGTPFDLSTTVYVAGTFQCE